LPHPLLEFFEAGIVDPGATDRLALGREDLQISRPAFEHIPILETLEELLSRRLCTYGVRGDRQRQQPGGE